MKVGRPRERGERRRSSSRPPARPRRGARAAGSGRPRPAAAPAARCGARAAAGTGSGGAGRARRAPARASPRRRATRRGAAAVPHASPSVRKLARELGVDLARVAAVRAARPDPARGRAALREGGHERGAAPRGAAASGLDLAAVAEGRLREVRARRATAALAHPASSPRANLARNWVMIPHVTQHDEADITELEAFRVELNQEHAKDGVKVTLLAFLVKACVAALQRFPDFNSSLEGDELVLKRYFHVGFAADTPNGLVVPVVQGRRSEGRARHRAGARRARAEGARRQAPARRHAGRDVLDLEPRRHRRDGLHAHHQRARGRDPRRVAQRHEAGVGRRASSRRGSCCPCRSPTTTASSTARSRRGSRRYLAQLLGDMRRAML